jgi:hypothetical protein
MDKVTRSPKRPKPDFTRGGHSEKLCHYRSRREQRGVLYLNPGSAGPRRFKLPITVERLYLDGKELKAEHIDLLDNV